MANPKEDDEITFPVTIKSVLWEKFKGIIPRTITLNDAVVELIKKEVEK